MPRLSDQYNEDENRNSTQDLLWAHGIKATAPRIAVIDFLVQQDNPLSIGDINKKLPKYSTASIYRTLDVCIDKGLVNRVNIDRSRALFELTFGRKHHHHIICTDCGDMEDSEKCLPQDIEKTILSHSKKFSALSHHSLEFFGCCKKCDVHE